MKRFLPYALLVCILAALLPYIDSARGDFVFDDVPLIQSDPFYKQEANPLKCWERDFWKENRKQGLYRPFTLFTYWLNAKTSGLYSPAFRTTNLILHMLVGILVFTLAMRMRLGHWPAIFAAVIFAVHPIHAEAVIPAFGRGELLCALFLLLSLVTYSYAGRNRYAIPIAGACFLLACWSKEHGLAALPLFVLLDLYLKRPSGRDEFTGFLKEKFPAYAFFAFVAAVFFASRYLALGTLIPSKANFDPFVDNQIALCKFPLDVISALKIQGLALVKFFWPATLCHDYSYAQLMPSVSVFDWRAWLTVLVFVSAPLGIVLVFRKLKIKIAFFVFAYLICILPAGNFIIMAGTIFGERLQYIPSIWLCMAVAVVASAMFGKIGFRTVIVLVALVVVVLSFRTYARGIDWENQMSLAVAGVRSAPLSVKTWNNLAVQLGEAAGREDEPAEKANKYQEAVIACSRAIKLHPNYVSAIANRGIYNSCLGNFKEAEADLRRAISMYPKHFAGTYTLGALLANQGRFDEAREIWEGLLEKYPDDKMLRDSYARLLGDINRKSSSGEK